MLRLVAMSALLATAPAAAFAQPNTPQDASTSGIVVEHAWARPTPPSATNGAAYMTVLDTATMPDRVTGVSSPVASAAEVHETINDHGIMKMRPVPSLAVEPGKPLRFAPGGYHAMLMGLKHPLKQGEHFPLTLHLEHAGAVTTTVEVGQGSGSGGMENGGMPMGGMRMGGERA
jgi:periplasmic copper chaperone A